MNKSVLAIVLSVLFGCFMIYVSYNLRVEFIKSVAGNSCECVK